MGKILNLNNMISNFKISLSKKTKKQKIIVLCFVSAALILITGLLFFLFGSENISQKPESGDLIYLKNNNIYTVNLNTKEKGYVTSFDGGEDSLRKIYNSIYTADDNSGILYITDTVNTQNGFEILYNSKSTGEIEVAENVKMYSVSKNIEALAYIKGEENKLYLWNNSENEAESEFIADNVCAVYIDEKGENISAFTYDNEIFTVNKEGDIKYIAENVWLDYFGEDVIYFTSDSCLYKYTFENGTQKIRDHALKLLGVGTAGDILYLSRRTKSFDFDDLLFLGSLKNEPEDSELISQYRDFCLEIEYYSLEYLDKSENEAAAVTVTDTFQNSANLHERKFGDHLRESSEVIEYTYKTVKNYAKGIYVFPDDDIDDIIKRIKEFPHRSEKKFYGTDYKTVKEIEKTSFKLIEFTDGSSYSLYRPQRAYLNIYYTENGGEMQFVDTTVGYMNFNKQGTVWYLKGMEFKDLTLFTCEKTDKTEIEKGIDNISLIPYERTREFYEFISGNERVFSTLSDANEIYRLPGMVSSTSGSDIAFCGVGYI